jgi:hypothetical protein
MIPQVATQKFRESLRGQSFCLRCSEFQPERPRREFNQRQRRPATPTQLHSVMFIEGRMKEI